MRHARRARAAGPGRTTGPDVSTSGRGLRRVADAAVRSVVVRRPLPFPPWFVPSSVEPSASDRTRPGSRLAAQRSLQRARDDVLGVDVVAEVVRDRVDRLLVAVERVEAVDAPVVVPVGEHLLAALRRRVRRALAIESAATALRTSTRATRNVRRSGWLSRVRSHGERPESPAVRSLPARGEPVVWGE